MHQKEQAIAPILQPPLGISITVPESFDTDTFGTFTREIVRPGDQRETARLKALKAMEITGETLAIASEGSFVPHPSLPMLPCDRELVVLIDTVHDLEVVGECVSTETNFSYASVSNFDEAKAFATKAGFPDHGLIVMVSQTTMNCDDRIKGIRDLNQLSEAVEFALARSTTGKIHIETDMRAMHNPTRMKAIATATKDLLQKILLQCPNCFTPGFSLVDYRSGLPCDWCGSPTDSTLAHLYQCKKCDFRKEELYPNGIQVCDPMYCQFCNP
jgi:hypothetical protein